MCIKELPGNKHVTRMEVEGFPEYNGTTITTEGVENCVDIPLWGGKAKLTYKQTKPGCFTSCVDTEAAGKWEIEEEYCESGIKSVSQTFKLQ